jgi:predicted amidophosphoribosyltransferase
MTPDTCPNCGREVDSNALHCPHCGASTTSIVKERT